MKKIGITGGIGSGKTTVCRIFEQLGVPVYYADSRAKALMTQNKTIVEGITKLFGRNAYLHDGTLNNAHIASMAFNDNSLLASLNALVHPQVGIDFESWASKQKSAYILKEAALLFESGSYKNLDAIIMVSAPENLRIERVLERDKTTHEAVIKRINNQWPESEKMQLSDYIIVNDGQSMLVPQVLNLHQKILMSDVE